MCKHLIVGLPIPEYRDVSRFRKGPFTVIKRTHHRLIPNIDDEITSQFFRKESVAAMHISPPAEIPEENNVISGASVLVSEADDQITETPQEIYKKIQEHLAWIDEHAKDMASSSAGKRQLEYLEKKLASYKSNVERSQNARETQKTFTCPDTVFLP